MLQILLGYGGDERLALMLARWDPFQNPPNNHRYSNILF